MISKELLSEVLGHDDICNERIIQNKLLYMCKNDGMIDYEYEYNIYELAHKCKEWAYNKGYEIVSLSHMIRIYKNGYEVYYTNSTLFDLDMFFKACQWILDNKEDI